MQGEDEIEEQMKIFKQKNAETIFNLAWNGKQAQKNVQNQRSSYLEDEILKSQPIEEYYDDIIEEGGNDAKQKKIQSFEDTRKTVKDVKSYPYCCMGLVSMKFPGSEDYGSGCLIGPRIVLTCAHNIYHEKKKEATDVKFSPAVKSNLGESFPVKNCYYPEEFKTKKINQRSEYDIALLELEDDLSDQFGYLGIDARNASEQGEIQICGYPANEEKSFILHQASGKIEESNGTFIKYRISTSSGQSGGPIIQRKEGKEFVIGVHTGYRIKEKLNFANMLNTTSRKAVNEWLKKTFMKLKDGLFFAQEKEKEKKIQYFQDGNKYQGECSKDGKRHGKGIFYFSNIGYRYEGDFEEGCQSGKGILYYPSGAKYIGDWKNGNKDGEGVYVFANGDRFNGGWKDDKMHGKGTMFMANKTWEQRNYENGKLEGEAIFHDENGNTEKRLYKNGQIVNEK